LAAFPVHPDHRLSVSPGDLLLFAGTLRMAARSVAHERLAAALEESASRAAEQGLSEIVLHAQPP